MNIFPLSESWSDLREAWLAEACIRDCDYVMVLCVCSASSQAADCIVSPEICNYFITITQPSLHSLLSLQVCNSVRLAEVDKFLS